MGHGGGLCKPGWTSRCVCSAKATIHRDRSTDRHGVSDVRVIMNTCRRVILATTCAWVIAAAWLVATEPLAIAAEQRLKRERNLSGKLCLCHLPVSSRSGVSGGSCRRSATKIHGLYHRRQSGFSCAELRAETRRHDALCESESAAGGLRARRRGGGRSPAWARAYTWVSLVRPENAEVVLFQANGVFVVLTTKCPKTIYRKTKK